METRIKISVIIPAYNRAKLLLQALESLMKQKFPKDLFEVIVVDNNSNDNTYNCITNFIKTNKNKINLKYTIEKKQGDIYARHTGAFHADGEILVFTDDDATFDDNWLEEIDRVFNENKEIGALGTRILILWDKEPPLWVKNYENLLGRITYGEGVIIKKEGLFINNGSLAIKKSIFYEVRGNNPGQIGEYLVGDAEVGLCRKLHLKNIPIGFTDKTTMWHHQFVAKNGTFRDIRRRVANNGRAEAFTDVFIERRTSHRFLTLKIIILAFLIFIAVFKFNKLKLYNSILKFEQLKNRYVFINKFLYNSEYKQIMHNSDWLLDSNYVGSELIYNEKIIYNDRTN